MHIFQKTVQRYGFFGIAPNFLHKSLWFVQGIVVYEGINPPCEGGQGDVPLVLKSTS